jgi:protein-S-isoprenylcysteine O-methyltransferase Ste14
VADAWRHRFERTKTYDLLAALPLIVWFLLAVWQQLPTLANRTRELALGTASVLDVLQLLAVIASIGFNFLLVSLLVIRKPPALKSKGFLPRLVAVLGTFVSVGIVHLHAVALPFALQALADVLLLGSAALATAVLAVLGDAFSVMPEARRLVTTGPYAIARHPLYTIELLGIAGLAIQFQQPWAVLLALSATALQVLRSVYEERVLLEAYPEYAAYRARTARFIPYVF